MYPKKAFTLIELLIVITIIGILSTLLFRTLSDMIYANSRIQQEKIMTQELITIQTSLNNISEHYPIIDRDQYENLENGFTNILYLKNLSWAKISLYSTWDCLWSWCYLALEENDSETKLTNPKQTTLSWLQFKILPTKYYTGSMYENLSLNEISAEGLWMFWNLSYRTKTPNTAKSSYTIQHFIHLQQ